MFQKIIHSESELNQPLHWEIKEKNISLSTLNLKTNQSCNFYDFPAKISQCSDLIETWYLRRV